MTMDNYPGRATLVSITVVLEGALLLGATIWSKMANLSLLPVLVNPGVHLILIGVGTACATVLLGLLCYRLGGNLPFFRALKKLSDEVLLPVVSVFTFSDIVLVSLASGICEEVLFRGVMLPLWGLHVSSILFGFVHSPTLKFLPYVIVTILAGYLFGYLYLQTGSLWPPVIAHVLHNLISLTIIRRRPAAESR